MEKSDRDHALQLIEMADRIISLIEHAGQGGLSGGGIRVHAQQTVEKSLKAWLTALHLPYPKSHDIGHLTELLERSGADLSQFPDLESYSAFAVQYRYEAYDATGSAFDRTA